MINYIATIGTVIHLGFAYEVKLGLDRNALRIFIIPCAWQEEKPPASHRAAVVAKYKRAWRRLERESGL